MRSASGEFIEAVAPPSARRTVRKMLFAAVTFLGLLVSIAVHELGHLAAARLGGMKVESYFIGFGPKLVSTIRNETEWGIRLLPLGGYVKIPGMDLRRPAEQPSDPEEAASVTYAGSTLPRQLAVAAAGPVTHFLLAVLLMFAALAFTEPDPFHGAAGVALVLENSPGAEAGFRTGDVVVSVNGKPTPGWDDVIAQIQSSATSREVVISRSAGLVTLHQVSREAWFSLGLPPVDPAEDKAFYELPGLAVTETYDLASRSVAGLVDLFSDFAGTTLGPALGTKDPELNRPTSLIGIIDISTEYGAGLGWYGVLVLVTQLNLVLGIFNLIPLHPLDGGHLLAAVTNRSLRRFPSARTAALRMLAALAYPVLGLFLVLFLAGAAIDLRVLGQDPAVWGLLVAGVVLGLFLRHQRNRPRVDS